MVQKSKSKTCMNGWMDGFQLNKKKVVKQLKQVLSNLKNQRKR